MKKITVHTVTGFLGSGKTTFIQALIAELNRRSSEKLVYIVNEYGQTGIDRDSLGQQNLTSYELTNGCICCTLKGAFSELLKQVISDHEPDRIIFEPSGLFVLSEMYKALSNESFSEQLCFAPVVCLIDAKLQSRSAIAFSPVLMNQSKLSDVIAISKLNLVPDKRLEIVANMSAQYPEKIILFKDVWELAPTDWDTLLNQPPVTLRKAKVESKCQLVRHRLLGSHEHPKLMALTLEIKQAICKDDLEHRLLELGSGQFGDILRAKGFVELKDKYYQVQVVNGQIDWHRGQPEVQQRFVVIGSNLQEAAILALFE